MGDTMASKCPCSRTTKCFSTGTSVHPQQREGFHGNRQAVIETSSRGNTRVLISYCNSRKQKGRRSAHKCRWKYQGIFNTYSVPYPSCWEQAQHPEALFIHVGEPQKNLLPFICCLEDIVYCTVTIRYVLRGWYPFSPPIMSNLRSITVPRGLSTFDFRL